MSRRHHTLHHLYDSPLGVSNTGVVQQPPAPSNTSSKSSAASRRVLKTGMIAKKPVAEMKGVRDDIEEEDSEESYYR